MTRVLLGAHVAFYIQGVQRLDAPWSKSIQLDASFGVWHLAFIFLSLSARTISRPVIHLAWHSPSKQGSFMPAKVRHNLRAGYEQIGLACVITGHGRAE